MKRVQYGTALLLLVLAGLAPLSALGPKDNFTLTVLSTNDTHGQPLAYPFSGAVEAGGTKFSFLFPSNTEPPKPQAQGNKVIVGGQSVSFDDKKISLGK